MSMKIPFAKSAPLLIAIAALLTGCGKNPPAAPAKAAADFPLPEPPLVADCAPGIPGGRLVIATFGDPKTFNPITANEQSSEEIYRHLFASLLGFDWTTQQVTPGLAESWTNTSDGKTWTFKLRKNLHWSDGEPLTADDVVFTWDVIYNPEIDNVMRDAFIIGGKKIAVTKLDDLTIQAVTPDIYAPFLENFGGVPILPKHILAKTVADKTFTSAYGVNWQPAEIVGSGPFRLKEYKPAQSILLERNPYFFEVDSNGLRMPYFDNIIYTVVPDMNAMSLRFLSGESDVDDFIFPYEYDRFKTGAAKGKFNLLKTPYLNTEYLGFLMKAGNEKENPLLNKKVRQAINYGFDRREMIQYLRKGVGRPAESGFTPYGLPSFDSEKVKGYTYDVVKAKQLLKEAGYANGNGLPEMKLYTNETYKEFALYVSKQLEQIGLKVKVEISQPAILREWMSQSKVNLFRGSWLADYPDAENYFAVFYSKNGSPPNYTRFSNTGFDRLYEKALAENDDVKRFELYHEMDRIIIDEAPIVPLYYDEVLRFSQKNIDGLAPNALNLLDLRRVKIN